MLLKQARKGQTQLINEDRQSMYVLISNGTFQNPTKLSFTGRISHERGIVPDLTSNPAGLSTNLQRFLSVEYTVDFLSRGDHIIDKNNKKWKLGPIDPLEKFKGIHGYQAPLEEAV